MTYITDYQYYENNDKKWPDVEGQLSKGSKPAGHKEEIRLEGRDTKRSRSGSTSPESSS